MATDHDSEATMNPTRFRSPDNPIDWHDAARARAEDLRREAMADFWRGADAWLGSAWQRAERSARRLAHRRQRHLASHSTPAGCGPTGSA
jgi:hypothetical protein